MSAVAGPVLMHASCVALGPQAGIVICGASGRGKSTLALALIERGAQLVGDDRLLIWRGGAQVFARAPATIAGLMEARGLGLIRVPALRLARLRLVVDADAPEPARLPEPAFRSLCGLSLPCLALSRAPSFPAALLRYLLAPTVAGQP